MTDSNSTHQNTVIVNILAYSGKWIIGKTKWIESRLKFKSEF